MDFRPRTNSVNKKTNIEEGEDDNLRLEGWKKVSKVESLDY